MDTEQLKFELETSNYIRVFSSSFHQSMLLLSQVEVDWRLPRLQDFDSGRSVQILKSITESCCSECCPLLYQVLLSRHSVFEFNRV